MDSDENDSQGSSSSDSETEVVNNNEPQSGLTNNNSPGSAQNSDSESSSSRSASPDEHIKQAHTPQSPDRGSVKSRSDRSPSSEHESVKSEDSRKSQHSKMSRRNSGSSGRSNKSTRRSNSRSSERGSIASEHRSRSRESVKSSPSPKSRQHDDGNSSDSSTSSRGSKRHKSFSSSHAAIPLENQAEEISDGEMDIEACKDYDRKQNCNPEENKMQLSHEDLSDVSDLDSMGEHSEDERSQSPQPTKSTSKSPPQDLRQKLDEAKNRKLSEPLKVIEKTSKTEDGEEALDFEAEDGECVEETPTKDDATNGENNEKNDNGDEESVELKVKDPEDLEEGEVTDDDETRPEETEPRPVCRFYSRGQCTWGASCRFLHPGVTDKGNYTMFEMIRPVVPGPLPVSFPGTDFRDERPGLFNHPLRAEPPPAESAWERGLRTAKEMVRRSIKRREQDMDFEEKKMNLTLSQDELDKENGYYTRAASPVLVEPTPAPVKHFVRHPPAPAHDPYYPPPQRHSEEYYRRLHHYDAATPPIPTRQVRIEPEYEPPPRERVHSYRELPTHRMPDYYNDKYEERTVTVSNPHKRHVRPKREVIVQRIETSAPPGRADEWADPWMRSKSPGARTGRPGRRQSYSSGSSYSSSSTSRSSSGSSRSSSYRRQSHKSNSRSRSGSPRNRRRVAVGPVPPISNSVPGYRRESRRRGRVSPSVIVSERKAANERAALMNPPAPSPRKPHKDIRPPSPGMMRSSAQNPPAPVKAATDQFGRIAKREVDRITSERRNLEPDRKKLAAAAALASRIKSKTRSSRSSSGSDSSGWSSSDSESSYSSSSTSRDGSPTTGPSANSSSKRKATTDTKSDLASLISLKNKSTDTAKGDVASKKRPASPSNDGPTPAKVAATSKPGNQSGSGGSGKKSTSRREELLKQLKAVEDAIAKKRSRIN